MAFRFAEEDFRRYVKKEEHGGRHIWDDLQERLGELFGVPFSSTPYVARGDQLRRIWFAPKGGPRSTWMHQAQFFLSRNVTRRQLTFGLEVERPTQADITARKLDPDLDALRLVAQLRNNRSLADQVDEFARKPGWAVGVEQWGEKEDMWLACASSSEILNRIESFPPEQGWSTLIQRSLSAEEAIAAGEGIVDQIMDTYQALRPLWEAIIPEADCEFLRKGQISVSEGPGEAELPQVRYWRISTGRDHEKWPEFRKQSIIAVDYGIAESLRRLNPQDSADLQAGLGVSDSVAKSLWNFYHEIRPGDHVYAYVHKGLAAWGVVKSDYYFVADVSDCKHRRNVTWERVPERPVSIERLSPELQRKLQQRGRAIMELTPDEGRAIEALFGPSLSSESPEEAQASQVLETILPDLQVRKMCLDLFADYILQAHAAGERCWEVTLSPKHQLVKLNVGWLRAFGISESCCAVIDPSALSKIEVATLEKEAEVRREGENFKLFQDSLTVWFKPAALGSILPIIAKSYQGFVERAARTGKTSPWWRSHSQGVTAYLRRFLGRDVPDPAYVDIVAPPPDILAAAGRALVSQGLHFTPWQLATFYTALQTKGFVILSGISGTGKTKLAQAFARLLPQPQEGDNWLFVSVRPDWRDSKSLLGYYNPLTGNYEWTDFLRFLLRAERNYRSESSLAWFVILDEMNLAHVEYYFADLLSVLESGRDEAGWTREPLRLSYPDGAQGDLPPRTLRLPPNLYIVGTVNVDETTQAFSPKVLDRAFTLELTEADFSAYPPGAGEGRAEPSDEERQAILEDFGNGGTFVRISKEVIGEYVREHPEVRERLQKLNELLRPHELHFGYRVFDEIVSFLDAAERNGLYEDLGGAEAAFDAAVLMKVLPKFHGSRGKLEAALKKVLAWCLNPDRPAVDDVERTIQGQGRESMDGGAAVEALAELGYTYQRTAGRVLRMLRALYETGFAAFA